MGHEATSRAGQQRGSAMGAHDRHTTPEMAVRLATAIEQRLTVVLEVAEQALEAQPHRSAQRVLAATGRVSGKLWQMALSAGVEVALCLVEHSMSNSNPTELHERISSLISAVSWQR